MILLRHSIAFWTDLSKRLSTPALNGFKLVQKITIKCENKQVYSYIVFISFIKSLRLKELLETPLVLAPLSYSPSLCELSFAWSMENRCTLSCSFIG